MTADARDFALEISEPLFRLTTECVRLRSNETRTFQSLSALMSHVLDIAEGASAHDTDILRDHMKIVPAFGDIALSFALSRPGIERLEWVRARLERQVGCALRSEELLSLLLFDYVIQQKTAGVLDTLRLPHSDNPDSGGSNSAVSD